MHGWFLWFVHAHFPFSVDWIKFYRMFSALHDCIYSVKVSNNTWSFQRTRMIQNRCFSLSATASETLCLNEIQICPNTQAYTWMTVALLCSSGYFVAICPLEEKEQHKSTKFFWLIILRITLHKYKNSINQLIHINTQKEFRKGTGGYGVCWPLPPLSIYLIGSNLVVPQVIQYTRLVSCCLAHNEPPNTKESIFLLIHDTYLFLFTSWSCLCLYDSMGWSINMLTCFLLTLFFLLFMFFVRFW